MLDYQGGGLCWIMEVMEVVGMLDHGGGGGGGVCWIMKVMEVVGYVGSWR